MSLSDEDKSISSPNSDSKQSSEKRLQRKNDEENKIIKQRENITEEEKEQCTKKNNSNQNLDSNESPEKKMAHLWTNVLSLHVCSDIYSSWRF